jgi:uncharacterized protein YkwD
VGPPGTAALALLIAAGASLPDGARAEPVAREYESAARPRGVVGGAAARAVASAVVDELRARGDVAEPDGALASAAAWFVGTDDESRKRGAGAAAARAGFVGTVSTAAAFPVGEPGTWRQALAALARNLPVTRYGVYVSRDGRLAGLVFGDVALKLAPIPRHPRAGDTLRLRGEIAPRFDRASIFVTGADGRIAKTRLEGRRFDTDVRLATTGIHRLEVMGDGAAGPTVLANVPIYVGVAEPVSEPVSPAPSVGVARTPEDAEARLLALLNDGRRAAGVAALVPDRELGAIARAHTREMAAGHFFGHASPTTGRVEDRMRRAGISVAKLGENISQGDSAEEAHRALMDSPGHRANMLDPAFTNVGIAVVLRPAERPALLTTLVFARRARAAAAPVTSAAARDFVTSRRRAGGAAALTFDPALQRAAEAGTEVILHGGASAAALDAAQAALAAEYKRLHQLRPAVCAKLVQVAELDELAAEPLVADPKPGRVGLAAATSRSAKGDTIFVLTVVQAETCK